MIRIDTFHLIRQDETIWAIEVVNRNSSPLPDQRRKALEKANNTLKKQEKIINRYVRAIFIMKKWYRSDEDAFPITNIPTPTF